MSKQVEQFARVVETLQKAKNNKTDIETFGQQIYSSGVSGMAINAAIDHAASQSETWRESFNKAFNTEFGVKNLPENFEAVKVLTEEQKELAKETFAVTVGGETGTADLGNMIQTNIVGAMDDIFQKTSILSRVQTINDTNSYSFPEFGAEISGDRVAENAGSTSKDDVPTPKDTLTVTNQSNKIRVSNVVSDLTLRAMRPEDYGIMQARLARAMNRRMETEIFTGSNASGQFCGYITTDTDYGALESTLPLSGVAGGVQDDVDALKYLISSLPDEFDDADLNRYVLAMNRTTKWRIKRTRDADGRTYDVPAEVENTEMYTTFALPNNRVGLFDLSKYVVLLSKPLSLEVRELDNEMYEVKMFTYADGGIRMADKAVAAKNGHRYIDLKADYAV